MLAEVACRKPVHTEICQQALENLAFLSVILCYKFWEALVSAGHALRFYPLITVSCMVVLSLAQELKDMCCDCCNAPECVTKQLPVS